MVNYDLKGVGKAILYRKTDDLPVLIVEDIPNENLKLPPVGDKSIKLDVDDNTAQEINNLVTAYENADNLIIGHDESNGIDCSAICYSCSNCGAILHLEIYEGDKPVVEKPECCSCCGIKFNNVVEL